MPQKSSGKGENESGPRRRLAESHSRHPVPTTENTKESGPRRIYAPPNTASSTSTKESGSRRLFTSSSALGRHPVIRGAKPKH